MTRTDLKKTLEGLHYILLLLLVAFMPFNLTLPFTNAKPTNIFLVLLAANAIPLSFFHREGKRVFNGILILFILVYLIHFTGLLKTDNWGQALKDLLEKKVSLLLLPLILYFSPRLAHKQTKFILITFVLSCLGTLIFCISIAIYRYLTDGTGIFLTYHEFSLLAGQHAVYLALFSSFSIIIIIFLYQRKEFPQHHYVRTIVVCALLILVISIVLLSARMHMILLVFGAVAFSVYKLKQKFSMLVSAIISVMIGISIVGIIFLFPQNRERFKQLVNYKNQYTLSGQWGERHMRPLIWSCSLQLIANQPLAGYGTGDTQDVLHQCYLDNNYTTLTYLDHTGLRYNAHNQYLQIILELGLPGLFVFLTSLILPSIKTVKEQHWIYPYFILLFAFSCLSESFLERQSGVIFFAFFNSLLYFHPLCTKRNHRVLLDS